jgi:hypothetical protein
MYGETTRQERFTLSLPSINSVVYFGKRRGHVVGYSTLKRHAHYDTVKTYCIVDLDPESAGYLEPLPGSTGHDSFISLMVVNPENFDDVIGIV